MAAITPQKLRRMAFAAELFQAQQVNSQLSPRLAVVALGTGSALTLVEVE